MPTIQGDVTLFDRPMVVTVGNAPNCAEFSRAWYDEIVRGKKGALAAHIEACETCKKWDKGMREQCHE